MSTPETPEKLHAREIYLPVFTSIDQPETCPQCGTRTDYAEASDGRQLHTCPSRRCGFSYLLEPMEA